MKSRIPSSPLERPRRSSGGAGVEHGEAQAPSPLDELSAVEYEALRWSVRAGDGLSPAEHDELQAWLRADPAHRIAFEEMAGVLDAVDEIPVAGKARLRSQVAIDKAVASSTAAAQENTSAPVQPALPLGTALPAPAPGRRIAARALLAGVVAVVAGGGLLAWQREQRRPLFAQQYKTQRGQLLEASLPDGSSLVLDTATTASVAFHADRREAHLPEGQVVFNVHADPANPFVVRAGAAQITVVGTRFAVRYAPSLGTQLVEVSVMEGRVRVVGSAAADPDAAVLLSSGQVVTADAAGRLGAVSTLDPRMMASWREKRLTFQDATLGAVVAELQRYGIDRVRVEDPLAADLRVTAGVDLRNISDFLRTLPRVLPVRTETRDGQTVITRAAG